MSIESDFKAQFVTQLDKARRKSGVSKSEMARRMNTSRASVHRVFDPTDTSITLSTMGRSVRAIGLSLSIKLG